MKSSSNRLAFRLFRPRSAWVLAGLVLGLGLAPWLASAQTPSSSASSSSPLPLPLPRAHAHNDYEHARPLLDALAQGFCSVEADIHLVDGKLLVAHDLPDTRPDRTLQALYLDPLRARVDANGGRVFSNGPLFTLLVDIKGNAEATYDVLSEVLKPYRRMLTVFRANHTATNAVTIILSGNRPWKRVEADAERLVALDGRLPDLDTNPSPHLVPLVSDNWRSHFTWMGDGPVPAEQLSRLKALVMRAHEQGRRLRFWATPDQPALWRLHDEAGVDFINTDRLPELAAFLRPLLPPGRESGVPNSERPSR